MGTRKEQLRSAIMGLVVIAGLLLFFQISVSPDVPAGYCESEKRVLTDREYTVVALRELVRHGRVKLEESEKKSISEFYKNREDCCLVTRPHKQSSIARIFSYPSRLLGMDDPVVVRVIFEERNDSELDKSQTFYEAFMEIGACGEFRRQYGSQM